MEEVTPHLWHHPTTRRWYIVWQEDGQPRRRSTRTTRRDHASSALRAFILDDGGKVERGPRKRLTAREGLEEWLADRSRPRYGLQPSTIQTYRSVVARVSAVLPARLLLRDVSPHHVRRALDRLETAGTPAREVGKIVRHLRLAFAWLERQGEIRRDPTRAVELPKMRRRRGAAIDQDRYGALLAALDRSIEAAGEFSRDRLEELRDLLEVIWRSGLRSIEAFRLRWESVDLDRATWQVDAPANKGGLRVQPIHRDLLPILRRRRLRGGAGPFSPRIRFTWSAWKKTHREWIGTGFHQLRHAFVTRLALVGEQAAASFLVGHASAQMTEHYTHLTAEDARSVLDRL